MISPSEAWCSARKRRSSFLRPGASMADRAAGVSSKGDPQANETGPAAALKEVFEETGTEVDAIHQ
eukprot:14543736-Alexandrium_andersonii.AAC.1